MTKSTHIPVVIVGGGPTGLCLALCLRQQGVECMVLEKNEHPTQHSRSIGIHPPSLQLFDQLGIAKSFLDQGIKIRKGHAYLGSSYVGSIEFSSLPAPHQYVLSIPQSKTEFILELACRNVDKAMVRRSVECNSFNQTNHGIQLTIKNEKGETEDITCEYLVGCDGKRSVVREWAEIAFEGSHYPDTYIMGDFEDTTPFGDDAMITLHQEGLVECFPLGDGQRRWVVKTKTYRQNPSSEEIKAHIYKRTGFDLGDSTPTMCSSFGVQHYLAKTFAKDRVLLAGDAAHVISPIGGQGMNLGWLDGVSLAAALKTSLSTKNDASLRSYAHRQRSMALQAGKRAEWNMRMGRSFRHPWLKAPLLNLLLHTPLQRVLAQLFTMQRLGSWWV